MQYRNNRGRAPLPERYDAFLELKQAIRDLRVVYDETRKRSLPGVIQKMERLLEYFEANEFVYRQHEIEEALKMPDLPYSVRIWLLYYLEKDMAQ